MDLGDNQLNLLNLPGGDDDDEEEGDFVPCAFSDDEEEEHDIDCGCPLCKYGDGGTGQSNQIVQRMEEMDSALTGTMRDDEIYKVQADLYKEYISEPLKKQGLNPPEITPDICKKHFSKHRINARRMIGREIQFCNTMQFHFRRQNILSRNNITGETRINTPSVKQWIQLSKHKLELIKYYKGPLSKELKGQTKTMQPYSFS
tara:strand:+ start:199 stop:804 length:606 start_codon:yes stop_codon:yes gene_type:complete